MNQDPGMEIAGAVLALTVREYRLYQRVKSTDKPMGARRREQVYAAGREAEAFIFSDKLQNFLDNAGMEINAEYFRGLALKSIKLRN